MEKYFMKKQVFFLFLLLGSLPKLNAQVSEISIMELNNYVSVSTLVRNYNGKHNIIMSYGRIANQQTPNGINERSSFYVQSTDNGYIQHIVDLPYGYKVNDIQFVYLRLNQSDYYVPYCCFCGTKTTGFEYHYPAPRDSTNVVIVPITNGFVGYFRVEDAISPSYLDTAVVRDVECSKELHRMTCYAELMGAYYLSQNAFYDNAVLDVIGIANDKHYIHNNLSALWRVKFYPEYPYSPTYPSGTRWDNNIRFNEDNAERMIDIIGTDNYVVTISHPTNDYKNIWLRYSNKERYLVNNGLELNSNIQQLELSSIHIDEFNIQNANQTAYKEKLRLAPISSDIFSLAFGCYNDTDLVDGIFTFKKDISDPSYTLNGSYDQGNYEVDELIYLPENNATAYLFHIGEYNTKNTGIVFWNYLNSNKFITNYLNSNYITLNSFCQYYVGDEFLSWSGIHESSYVPPYLLSQKIGFPMGTIDHCQNLVQKNSPKSTVVITDNEHEFLIKEKYPDYQDKFPVTKIPFSPYAVNNKVICETY